MEFIEEATELIEKEAFEQNSDALPYTDFSRIFSDILPRLCEIADSRGETAIIYEIIDILRNRLDSQEYRQNIIPRTTSIFLSVLPYDRAHTAEDVYKYIIQFRDMGIAENLFRTYSERLLLLEQEEKMTALLKLSLAPAEEKMILSECAKYGFRDSSKDVSSYFVGKNNLSNYSLLYLSLRGKTEIILPPLPSVELFTPTIREHDQEERAKWKDYYHEGFLLGLLYFLNKRQKDLEEWITDLPNFWSSKAMSSLLQAASKIADGIQASNIGYVDLFNSLKDLEALQWPGINIL